MLEKGQGTVKVVDPDRGLQVTMIYGDADGYQEYRLTGPEMDVVFGTDRYLDRSPPMWRIRMIKNDEPTVPDEYLLLMIEQIVSFMAADLLDVGPDSVIATFHPDRY